MEKCHVLNNNKNTMSHCRHHYNKLGCKLNILPVLFQPNNDLLKVGKILTL